MGGNLSSIQDRGRGDLHSAYVSADAAPGNYKIVAAMPDRDGDHVYRIKSPLEEYERVAAENLLVRSRGYLPEEVLEQSSRRGLITLPKLTTVLSLQPEDETCSCSVHQRGSDLQNQIERNLLQAKFATRANQCLSGRLRGAAEVDAIEAGKAIPRCWAPNRHDPITGPMQGMRLGLRPTRARLPRKPCCSLWRRDGSISQTRNIGGRRLTTASE